MFKALVLNRSLFSICSKAFNRGGLLGVCSRTNQQFFYKDKIPKRFKLDTVDVKEIDNFNAYSESDWFPQTRDNVLLKFNHFRTNFLLKHVSNKSPNLNGPLSGKKILDIGSGAGIFAEKLAALGGDVLGVDPSSKSIEIAHNNALNRSSYLSEVSRLRNEEDVNNYLDSEPMPRSLRYFKGGVEHIQPSDIFDIIVASEVIEHVNDSDVFVRLISKLLKKDGIVLFTTLNRTILCYIYSIIFGERILEMIPKGTHDWKKFIKPEELDRVTKKYNLYRIGKAGAIYVPGPNTFIELERMDQFNYLVIYKKKSDSFQSYTHEN